MIKVQINTLILKHIENMIFGTLYDKFIANYKLCNHHRFGKLNHN